MKFSVIGEFFCFSQKVFNWFFFVCFRNPTLKPNLITIIPVVPPSNPPLLMTPPKPTHFRKLTHVENQFRRANGLCFTCDEKFSPSHCCASKPYFIIQFLEELPLDQEHLNTTDPPIPEPEHGEMETHHLSYNALTGIPTKHSIWFFGHVKGRQFCILMDDGSSDSFIHPRLASSLDLTVRHTSTFKVKVDSSELLQWGSYIYPYPDTSLYFMYFGICTTNCLRRTCIGRQLVGNFGNSLDNTRFTNFKEGG